MVEKKPTNKWATDIVGKLLYALQKPDLGVKTNFFRLMAVAQESWLGMRESIKSIHSAETNSIMKKILAEILKDLNEGQSLSFALGGHAYFFSDQEIQLINAAEKMGNIPEVLKDMAVELENTEKINAKVKKAIMYPAWLLCFTLLAVGILLIFVIPTIVDLYGDTSKLPPITKFMISASDFIKATWYVIIIGVVGSFFWFKIAYAKIFEFKKRTDIILMKIPAVNWTIKTFYMYSFSKLFGDFGKAGVWPTDALEQMRKIFENYLYKRKMMAMKNDLENWFTISDSIEWSDLFDPILIQIVMVGEKTGNLSPILLVMSNFYRYQLEGKIDALVGTIEPIMMGIMAGMIGAIVAAVFLPLWWLMDVVGG